MLLFLLKTDPATWKFSPKYQEMKAFKHKPMEIINRSLKFFGNKQSRRGHEKIVQPFVKPNQTCRYACKPNSVTLLRFFSTEASCYDGASIPYGGDCSWRRYQQNPYPYYFFGRRSKRDHNQVLLNLTLYDYFETETINCFGF
jgi:hypothetical protein